MGIIEIIFIYFYKVEEYNFCFYWLIMVKEEYFRKFEEDKIWYLNELNGKENINLLIELVR